MSDLNSKNIVVYGIFAGTAIWAIVTLDKLEFGCPAFIIQIIHGVFGLATNSTSNSTIRDGHNFTTVLCHDFVVSLMAAEATLMAEIEKKWAFLHLIVPAVDLLFYCLGKNFSREVLDLSKVCSIGMIGFSAFNKDNNLWGYALTVLYVIAEFSYEFSSETQDETEAVYCIGSAAGDVALWKFTQ